MQVGSAQTNAVQLQAGAESSGSSEIAERWYGPALTLLTVALILMSAARGYYPVTDSHLAISIVVAILLVIGGELFIVSLPFSWGTAQVSVGAICGLGVSLWLGPVYGPAIILVVAFVASYRQWKHAGLALENAASAAVAAAVAGLVWWALVPTGANPLTSIRTTVLFLVVAILHSVVKFGTVVVGTSLARREPILKLIYTMSGGKNFIFTIPVLAAFIPLIGSQSPIALLFFAIPLVSSHLALRALWRLETDTQTTLAALTDILELRDPYTAFHSERVSIYSVAIAQHVTELTAKELATLERAARIHDIGKAAVRDAVLLKNGPLTDEERRSIESHASIGADLIARMHAYRDCVELIRHHHERWDGGGYPSRLIGDRIPLGARIMAVADSLDAMTTDRPYRKALSFEAAVAEIRRNSGSQFDSRVVEAFFAAINDPEFERLAEDSRSRLAAD
ncbi:MAG TPA: HD-GYP domain-containing protein [Thermomicrobiales bacterium]|nr:HD-GYP domain-containing protein [Thermomicrobiales bacterium]